MLVFLDSRGVCGALEGSLIERMLERLAVRRKFLAVCRPLELTTWATLFNALAVNDWKPRTVITNVGFVDFTPKKRSILDDSLAQVEARMGQGVAYVQYLEDYPASNGEMTELFTMRYTEAYRGNIENALRGRTVLVINSPRVDPALRVPRRRPASFFSGLRAGNEFNRSLAGAMVIEPRSFDETQTYDGVHYTNAGNELIFRDLEPLL